MFKGIFDYVMVIVIVIAVLMFTIGGFLFMVAHMSGAEMLPGGIKGGPKLLNRAKSVITSTAIGLFLIFAAWIIINTIFMFIGVADWTGLTEGWWKINCPIEF